MSVETQLMEVHQKKCPDMHAEVAKCIVTAKGDNMTVTKRKNILP